jgi:protein ImuB
VFDAALRRLVEQVADQLACRQLGAMRLEALLFRPREAPVTHGLTLCAPNRSARHLSDMLFAQLERVDWRIGFDGMEVAARRTGPLPPAQTDMFASDRARDPRAAAELWDRLAARLGREAVVRPQPVASHQPERAIAWRPIQVGPVQPLAHPFASLSNRPARLLRRPRRIEASAVAPDHPPFQIRARGRAWRVHCGDGPERIEPAWWSDDAGDAAISARAAAESDAEPRAPPARESRDYFRIELENGMRWWVYREASSRHWFVHGLFA